MNILRSIIAHTSPFFFNNFGNQGQRLVILAYHGVTNLSQVVSLGYGLQLWHEIFDQHCSVIKKYFKSTHPDEFFDSPPDSDQKISVLFSFDDIYENVISVAVPILEKYQLKYILFPSSRFATGNGLFWWDKLRFALLTTPYTKVEIENRLYRLRTRSEREVSIFQLEAYLANRPPNVRDSIIDDLYDPKRVEATFGKILSAFRPAPTETLQAIRNSPLCRIGVHSATHPDLKGLSGDEIRSEFVEQGNWYKNNFGEMPQDICFPFGETSPGLDGLSQESGFLRGYTLTSSKTGQNFWSKSDTYRILNRYSLRPDDSVAIIKSKVRGAFDIPLKLLGENWF